MRLFYVCIIRDITEFYLLIRICYVSYNADIRKLNFAMSSLELTYQSHISEYVYVCYDAGK